MGSVNYLILVLLITEVVGNIQAEPEPAEIEASIAVVTTEFELLRSKVTKLELILKDKNNDLNIKRNFVTQREKVIEGQSQTINSVQNIIEDLQQKESGDTNTQVVKAYARIKELETQVEGFKESIRKQKKERAYFKLQADEAEKKAKEQVSKYEKMEYFVSEQWVSIGQTEQALQIAEEIMLKAQAEAAAKAANLSKAYRGWLSTWVGVDLPELQVSLIKFICEVPWEVEESCTYNESHQVLYPEHLTSAKQTLVTSYWGEHAEPVMKSLREKASALLLLPLFGMFMIYSFIFGVSKKTAKPARSSHTRNTRRKSIRSRANKQS